LEGAVDQLQTWLERSNVTLEAVLATVAIVIVAWIALILLNRLLRKIVWQEVRRARLSYEASLTATRVVTGAVWVFAALMLLNVWGVNVAGLWTILISAAAVIGVGFLAVWTMVSNITASLFLTIWRPFHLGQTIEVLPESFKGRVIDRNMMFTTVRDEQGSVLQVPNNLFFQKMFRVTDSGERSLFELLEADDEGVQRNAYASRPRVPAKADRLLPR
jgi:small-conductance mechanosensitive channel